MMRASFRETHGTGVIALIQRVSEASVTTGNVELGRIGPGLVALVRAARARHGEVAAGRFGADMRVALVNDGPVTFLPTA